MFVNARRKHDLPNLKLPARLMPYFCGYSWPGNVRELENVVERLTVLAVGDEITGDDLPDFLRRAKPDRESIHFELPPEGLSLEAVEKDLITKALRKFTGNQTKAAAYLDISRRTLIYRMEKHGITRDAAEEQPAPKEGTHAPEVPVRQP
jgi:DNA-binding NtrC family response regulator